MRCISIIFLFLFPVFIASCQNTQAEQNKQFVNKISTDTLPGKDSAYNEITLLLLGDIMEHDLQIQSSYNAKKGKYDFSSQFKDIQPIISNSDAVIANLEVTLSGAPYKGYPRFSSPDQLAVDIKNAGINYLVTANNHVYDYGIKGFKRTLNVLDTVGIIHTGTFRNKEDKAKNQPMVIEKNGLKIALLNYTYAINGGTYSSSILINKIDTSLIKRDLIASKKANYDAIIVFFHWGKEYQRQASPKQINIANFCFENGAKIVIGSHPHVIQEMNKYQYVDKTGKTKDVFVAYSLGNYVANYGSRRYTDGGALVQLKLRKHTGGKITIENAGYYLVWVYRQKRSPKSKYFNYYVLPVSQHEKDTNMDAANTKQMKLFVNDARALLKKNNLNVPEFIYDVSTRRWKTLDK